MTNKFKKLWDSHTTSIDNITTFWDDKKAWSNKLLYENNVLIDSLKKMFTPSNVQLEYRKIDFVVFSKETLKNIDYYDNSGFIEDSKIPLGIEIAIEHENNFEIALEEMIKLVEFKAKLKILITYPKNDECKVALINKFEKCIKQSNMWLMENTETEYLLICGFKFDTGIKWTFNKFNTYGFNKEISN